MNATQTPLHKSRPQRCRSRDRYSFDSPLPPTRSAIMPDNSPSTTSNEPIQAFAGITIIPWSSIDLQDADASEAQKLAQRPELLKNRFPPTVRKRSGYLKPTTTAAATRILAAFKLWPDMKGFPCIVSSEAAR